MNNGFILLSLIKNKSRRMEIKTNINLSIKELARVIKNLRKDELKMLESSLSAGDKILKRRLDDVKSKKVKLLSRNEVFPK